MRKPAYHVRFLFMNTPFSELRKKRILAGMTLDELGLQVGVSSSFLSRVERGYAHLKPEKERALRELLKSRTRQEASA